jgi:hypothetical protein
MGLAVGTVRKHACAGSFPVPETRPLRPSILEPYLARLEARLAEGCENGLALWRELRAAGFPGTAKQVHRWLASAGRLRPGLPRTSGGAGDPPGRRRPDPAVHPHCLRQRGWRGCSSGPSRSCRRPMRPW